MTDDVIDGEAVEETDLLPVVREPSPSAALVARDEITVTELVAQAAIIEHAMREAMREGVHYGRIPGVSKPTLLKPGAEKLNVLFRLAPEYDSEKLWHDDGHLTVMVKCRLRHIPTGLQISEGEGLCSTREAKYAYRQGGRVCPDCGQDAIIKGKAEYGGGWLCFRKKGGCGAKFADDTEQAQAFETAEVGRVPNPDLPDSFNTVLKMADKRALLAAVLNGTAASDVFTQDIGDEEHPADAPRTPAQAQRPFDPARDTLPGAPAATGAAVNAALNEVEPSIAWKPMISEAVAAVYGGVSSVSNLPPAEKREALNRLANVAAVLIEARGGDGFPPLADEVIADAFARMFDGAVVTVPAPEAP